MASMDTRCGDREAGGTVVAAATGGSMAGVLPANAFDGDFLDRLLEQDQPSTAARAAVAGPWEVRPSPAYGWAVVRQGDTGDPVGLLEDRQDGLLLAAALPGSAQRAGPKLRPERGPDGYRVVEGAREMGCLAWFDTDLVADLGCLRDLIASPRSLALLLEAAGHDALEQAGRILARRTAASDG